MNTVSRNKIKTIACKLFAYTFSQTNESTEYFIGFEFVTLCSKGEDDITHRVILKDVIINNNLIFHS